MKSVTAIHGSRGLGAENMAAAALIRVVSY